MIGQTDEADLRAGLSALEHEAELPAHLIDRALAAAQTSTSGRAAHTTHIGISSPTRDAPTRRWGLLASAVALVAAAVIGIGLLVGPFGSAPHSTTQRSTPPASARTWHSWFSVHFPVPAGWTVKPATFLTGAVDPPQAYITNQPIGPECNGHSCGPPLKTHTIGRGGILITITAGSIFEQRAGRFRANTTIAGLPTIRTDMQCGQHSCLPGGVRNLGFTIKLPPTSASQHSTLPLGLFLDITIGANGGHAMHQVMRMLKDATYP